MTAIAAAVKPKRTSGPSRWRAAGNAGRVSRLIEKRVPPNPATSSAGIDPVVEESKRDPRLRRALEFVVIADDDIPAEQWRALDAAQQTASGANKGKA